MTRKKEPLTIPQVSFLGPDGQVRSQVARKKVKVYYCHACKRPFLLDELHSISIKGFKYRFCLSCVIAYKTRNMLIGGSNG